MRACIIFLIGFTALAAQLPAQEAAPADESEETTASTETVCQVIPMPGKPFTSTAQTRKFQSTLDIVTIDGTDCRLQNCAAQAFVEARSSAAAAGIELKQRGTGSVACLRSYYMTVYLWQRHLFETLDYLVSQKTLTRQDIDPIKNHKGLYPPDKVLAFEKEHKVLLGKYGSKSIIYSASMPGTTEHLAGLAIDIEHPKDPLRVSIMNAAGWYQRTLLDPNHFIYLGKLDEAELKNRGFKKRNSKDITYWTPGKLK